MGQLSRLYTSGRLENLSPDALIQMEKPDSVPLFNIPVHGRVHSSKWMFPVQRKQALFKTLMVDRTDTVRQAEREVLQLHEIIELETAWLSAEERGLFPSQTRGNLGA